jgi:hypothetical protein
MACCEVALWEVKVFGLLMTAILWEVKVFDLLATANQQL